MGARRETGEGGRTIESISTFVLSWIRMISSAVLFRESYREASGRYFCKAFGLSCDNFPMVLDVWEKSVLSPPPKLNFQLSQVWKQEKGYFERLEGI